MKYETVMGLEVHVELATASKLFCACSAAFGANANENVCPACCGMPGMPAVLNKRAVELGIAAALVTNSKIAGVMSFDKKNYFYPDLPTGYQITQFFAPICTDGRIEIETASGKKEISLKQIHIEEDAGKLVHDAGYGKTLVDYNRASVPLIEIVSNPDFRSAEEVVAYLEKLRSLLSFAGVSDCKMQEGQMRVDVNLSVRPMPGGASGGRPGASPPAGAVVPTGQDGQPLTPAHSAEAPLGVRTEIKNMNSLKAIVRAIEFERQRHMDILDSGSGGLVQETRRWDDAKGESFAMRDKEDHGDYRYFPNAEILPLHISTAWIEAVRAALPESAAAKFARMTAELGLSEYDSRIITGSRALSAIFDGVSGYFDKPKVVVNWIMVELLSIAKGDNKGEDDISIDSQKFAKLIELVDTGTINRTTGKDVLIKVLEENVEPESYIAAHGLANITDDGFVDALVAEVLSEHEKSVKEYLDGNQKAFGFLVGQVMRKAERKADPKAVNELLRQKLGAM